MNPPTPKIPYISPNPPKSECTPHPVLLFWINNCGTVDLWNDKDFFGATCKTHQVNTLVGDVDIPLQNASHRLQIANYGPDTEAVTLLLQKPRECVTTTAVLIKEQIPSRSILAQSLVKYDL